MNNRQVLVSYPDHGHGLNIGHFVHYSDHHSSTGQNVCYLKVNLPCYDLNSRACNDQTQVRDLNIGLVHFQIPPAVHLHAIGILLFFNWDEKKENMKCKQTHNSPFYFLFIYSHFSIKTKLLFINNCKARKFCFKKDFILRSIKGYIQTSFRLDDKTNSSKRNSLQVS